MADYARYLRDIVGGAKLLQIPSVSVVLRDGEGRVLVARHTEGNVWVLPGGAVEPGETPSDAAVVTARERTCDAAD
jgi:ADP-ribose pyrophosphatase YjhB (NUDIX family)